MKYKHKPTLVDAFFWTGTIEADFPAWLAGRSMVTGTTLEVSTTNLGKMTLEKNTWLVRWPDGKVYPTGEQFFKENYESAE